MHIYIYTYIYIYIYIRVFEAASWMLCMRGGIIKELIELEGLNRETDGAQLCTVQSNILPNWYSASRVVQLFCSCRF